MNRFRFRPTFELAVTASRAEAIERLKLESSKVRDRERFAMYGEYGELHLPAGEHRLWSPHLSFYLLERDGHCYLFGRFAPRPDVWTTVWIVYLAMIFAAFFGTIIAYTQWSVGTNAWGIWIVLASLAVIAGLYGTATVGQQWSSDQMQQLKEELLTHLACADVISLGESAHGQLQLSDSVRQ